MPFCEYQFPLAEVGVAFALKTRETEKFVKPATGLFAPNRIMEVWSALLNTADGAPEGVAAAWKVGGFGLFWAATVAGLMSPVHELMPSPVTIPGNWLVRLEARNASTNTGAG